MKKLTILLFVLLSTFILKAQEPVPAKTKVPLDSLGMVERIKELEKELNERGSLKDLVQRLRQENKDLKQDTVPLYKETVKQLKAENSELRDENEKLSVFKGALLAQLSDNVIGRWLNMPYCQIDSLAFSDTLALFEKYKDDNPKVERAYTQMVALAEDLNLYRRAKIAVNSPYDEKTVKALTKPMEELSKKVNSLGSNRKNNEEITELYDQLYYYKGKLMVFRWDIIDIVENDIERWKEQGMSAENAWINLESDLSFPGSSSNISQISPWLRKQYKAFYEQLKRDVYGPNPAKEIIKNLVPER